MDNLARGKLPFTQWDKPKLAYLSVTGAYYTQQSSETPGGYAPGGFIQGVHTLKSVGATSVSTSSQAAALIAMGMSGLKSYYFDFNGATRADPDNIGQSHQTGASPWSGNTASWQAQASVFNLISDLEPYIIAPHISSPLLGTHMITGLKKGTDHNLLIVVNLSEVQRPLQVDLPLYLFPDFDTEVVLYRLRGATTSVTTLPSDTTVVDRQIQPGEAYFLLFHRRASITDAVPSIEFTSPVPNLIVGNDGSLAVEVAAKDTARVDFYLDGSLISSIASPERFSTIIQTEGLMAGIHHSISAIAFNSQGVSSQARTTVFVECTSDDCDSTTRCRQSKYPQGMSCIDTEPSNDVLSSEIEVDPGLFDRGWGMTGMTTCCFNYDTFITYSHQTPGLRNVTITIENNVDKGWSKLTKVKLDVYGGFYISLDSNGLIDDISPPSATIGSNGRSLIFKTTKVSVDPGPYQGTYGFIGNEDPVGPIEREAVPYIAYTFKIGSSHGPHRNDNQYMVDVKGDGSLQIGAHKNGIHLDEVPNFATVNGRTIIFNTVEITVNPGLFSGVWSISGKAAKDLSGQHNVALVISCVYHLNIEGFEYKFEVDSEGKLVDPVSSSLSVDNSGATPVLSFVTSQVTLTIDPYEFEGSWMVLDYMSSTTTSPTTLELYASASYRVWISGYSFYFELDSSGSNVKVLDAAKNYAPEIASFSPGTQQNNATLTFNTNQMSFHPGLFQGRYYVGSVTNAVSGNMSTNLLPSFRYSINIGAYKFYILLDSSGNVESVLNQARHEAPEIASYSAGTLSFNTNSFNINSDCSARKYYIGWVSPEATNGNTAIELIPSMSYNINLGSNGNKRFDLDSTGEVTNVHGDGLKYLDYSGASLTINSCWCDNSCA